MKLVRYTCLGLLVALTTLAIASLAAAGGLASAATADSREITVHARQFAYDPAVIRVAQGQRVRIIFEAMDVTHGLSVDGYGLEVKATPGYPKEIEFVAGRAGQFRFRCTQTCGTMHPFMVGKLLVTPNMPFGVSFALAALLPLGFMGLLWLRREAGPLARSNVQLRAGLPGTGSQGAIREPKAGPIHLDLLRLPIVGEFLRWRGFQFALMLPFALFMVLALVAGLWGSPVGSHNLGIVFVWVVWWALLIIVFIPVGGRAWCAVCPLPGPGEWLQRLSFIRRRAGRQLTLGRRWPVRLRGIWLQNGAFLLIALFSAVILTTPLATAVVLGGFFVAALVLSLTFQGRAFCRYVCPLGGFIGVCSLVAPLAVRVKDPVVCREHKGKECVRGSAAGYGCPWFEYPGRMTRNAYCGLCMECVKTCPQGNIAVGFQSFGRDLVPEKGRLDEAFRAFIALASAALYSAVMLGPWGWLKGMVAKPLTPGFALYAAIMLGGSLIVVPALFLGMAWLAKLASGRKEMSVARLWKDFSYGLVPLALMAWIAFSMSLVLVSGYHVVPVVSDPLGRGWDLLGTASFEGGPVLMGWLPYLQVGAVLIGLSWSLATCWQIARRVFPTEVAARQALLPVGVLLAGVAATFLWLYQG